ncbi:tRNA dimethylallyltransferase [Enterovirga rhinocerotis]|uniref:tRNA dimethylallyltransferase n=1 Tax=Enterovirga rhinocerotis TaxID=1339210 RepID=A0A4R7C960_9HYPH|nr:tRNA dimethylallyltransferase [Enterovirga rhinocerotis]
MRRVEAILIAGPTASGKSALALRLARDHGGVVINADSMQVYRDLRILSARPSEEEEGEAPHRLYGHVDGAVNYSAGLYVADMERLLRGLPEGTLPIVVGGTGLYFKALTEGLSDLPAVPEEVRAEVRAQSEGRAAPELHAELARRDPESAARLKPGDRQRILRALEIVAATGRPIGAFQGLRRPGPLDGRRMAKLFIAPAERAELRARIDRRVDTMMERGALDEVHALAARGLDPALPIMRAHGVPGFLAHLRGEVTLAEAIRRGQADTRAYAKRQFTWFRHQMPDFHAVPPEAADEALRGMV